MPPEWELLREQYMYIYIFSLGAISLMTSNVDILSSEFRDGPESNIGLIIKNLIFAALNISFLIERLAGRCH